MEKRINSGWGHAAGIVSGVTYGMNPLFGVPVINKGLDVNSLLFYRYAIAVLLMLVFMLFHHDSMKINRKQFGMMLVLGALFTLCSITLFESYKYIPSGIATSVLFVYPIMVALIMLFFGQRPGWQTWVSILAGVVGAVLLSYDGKGGLLDGRGIVLVVLSGLFYSLFIVIVNRSKEVRALPNLTMTFYCFLIGTVMLSAFSLFGPPIRKMPDAACWLNVAGLAVFPTVLATVSLAAATKSIGPTRTSVMGILEPLTAITIGVAVFGEPFTLHVAIGVVLILFSILFMIGTAMKRNAT